jgi:protein-disulfide isomerase
MNQRSTSRRAFLAAAGGTAVALAGCLGSGDPGGSGGDSLPTPAMGSEDAGVTVKAWEDFSCSHCATFNASVLPRIVSDYVEPGVVRFEHHDFPFLNAWSWNTAIAARAVQAEVGVEAFFSFSKPAFESYADMDWDRIRALAESAGADPDAVVSAAENDTYRPTVEADKSRGQEMGVRGTPTLFVDGQQVQGYGYDAVRNAIESSL